MPVVGNEIIDPLYYERYGYPHASWEFLRRHRPVAWMEPPGMKPFWAVTRYADVSAISRDAKRWKIAPRIAVFPEVQFNTENPAFRHLLNMDPPEHGKYRNLLSLRFTPKTLEPKREVVGRIVDEALARLAARREADFVEDFAATIPLAVIAEMIGLPRQDWRLMFDLSNAIIASEDPEFQKGATTRETIDRAVKTSFDYFRRMVEERRHAPRDDLASALATGEVMGAPIAEWELLSYFVLLLVAGNETTRNATSGALLALLEHRDQLERLRADPSLVPSAVEEIVRWVSPVIQFCRTAGEEIQVGEVTVHPGEAVCLLYPSANRDEAAFPDPFVFRVDREPNEHLGFGIGVHYCLGANLARLELQEIVRRLVPRLDELELAGPIERMRSSFVGGIKHMPIRYRLRG
jgi:cholest-4-en-3-one 26-monooxygenase